MHDSSPISSIKNATSTKGSDNGLREKRCWVGHAAMLRALSRKSIAGRRYSPRKRYSRNEDNPSSRRGGILI